MIGALMVKSDVMVEIKKIVDFAPDPMNANIGTSRGGYLIRKSLESVGVGRSLVADKHGMLIAGNKTQEALVDLGIEDVIVVQTDGTKAVIVQRTDLDLNDEDINNPARQYAYYDNRSSQFVEFDPEIIKFDIAQGIDLSNMFHDFEIDEMLEIEQVEFKEYDESIADDVKMIECPECGHNFPK